MSDRVEIKTIGEGYDSRRAVFLDGKEVRSFDCVSDDYAHTNAKEYADELLLKINRSPEENLICPNFKGNPEELEKFKPKKGQPVFYKGEAWGIVERVEDAICHITKYDGEHTLFIWKFTNSRADGLNNLHVWWL